MAEDSRDTLMKLETTAGKYVPAECSAVVASDDKLGTDFKGTHATGNLIRGNYFAIDDFSFDVGIAERGTPDQMEAQAEDTRTQIEDVANQVNRNVADLHQRINELEAQLAKLRGGTAQAGSGGIVSKVKSSGGKSQAFSRFMVEGRSFTRKEKNAYPSDLEPVSITKHLDISSPVLFDNCRSSFKFNSATILKRKPIGGDVLYGFLRVDFTDVMLIELNWDDDEVTKESFKFVCRKAVVTYSMETPSTDPTSKNTMVLTQMPAVTWNVLPTS